SDAATSLAINQQFKDEGRYSSDSDRSEVSNMDIEPEQSQDPFHELGEIVKQEFLTIRNPTKERDLPGREVSQQGYDHAQKSRIVHWSGSVTLSSSASWSSNAQAPPGTQNQRLEVVWRLEFNDPDNRTHIGEPLEVETQLRQWNGRSFLPKVPAKEVFTDASDLGWGIVTDRKTYSGIWSTEEAKDPIN
ncbi:hypothetical protein AX774_g7630, partial [Zancudomyces culisetae]